MAHDRIHFLLLNVGHFLDHFFMLIFATVAALALVDAWALSYAQLLAYAAPGFFAFGVLSLPAGWLADRWGRDKMMCVFFVGIGASAIATGAAQTPLQIGVGLLFIGAFGAIYHPVGLAIVSLKWRGTGMRLAVNGVWGNLGVAAAALVTGVLIDWMSWRTAFILPGTLSIALGAVYWLLLRDEIAAAPAYAASTKGGAGDASLDRAALARVGAIVFLTTALVAIIFQSTTFALPKVFDERLSGLAGRLASGDLASTIGALAFMVFAVASVAQLVVGRCLDRYGARSAFLTVAAIQVVFFAAMPGLIDGWALVVAFGFMLGAFGQIPINDFVIGRTASGRHRALAYGIRYVVSFTALAATLPLVAFVHANFGFDALFRLLAVAAAVVLLLVLFLPARLPEPRPMPVQ